MASTSARMGELKEVELSGCSGLDGSADLEYVPAHGAMEIERAAPSSPPVLSAGNETAMEGAESGNRTLVKRQIERSKVHWSLLSEPGSKKSFRLFEMLRACWGGKGAAEIDNAEVFKTLEEHPTLGDVFFWRWDEFAELKVGEKFAEGAQAELFHAQVTWKNPKETESDREDGTAYVLKVFKKGTLLRHLQLQWPYGMMQFTAEIVERIQLGKPAPNRYICNVRCGTLLKDGRFAFLMVREREDLRRVIDRNMMSNIGGNHGPFEKDNEDAELIMYRIALGMDWLHSHNIVHRDIKASNVLVDKIGDGPWQCFVADYECSIGVVGTGFWRAPEILQACKERNVSKRPELFTKQADVYSYGMTCYEILTGKLPFDNHPWWDYDLVLDGNRPEVPEYVDDWACGLLNRCWQSNPLDRPSFGDILNLLEANSAKVRDIKLQLKHLALREEQLWLETRLNQESVGVEA